MGIFDKFKKTDSGPISPDETVVPVITPSQEQRTLDHAMLSDMALATISDGVVIVDGRNKIELLNPAAVTMLGYIQEGILGIDAAVIFKFETGQGIPIEEHANQMLLALKNATPFTTREYVLINGQNQKRPISLTVTPVPDKKGEKIITFRDISKELEEEGAQAEFISTASHEMRTPVASIEGYLGLALNPSCATIDDRARKYLEEAHASSQHLGRLFRDLLDVTKLDDKKLRIHPVPLEVVDAVRKIVDSHVPAFAEKKIRYTFGSNSNMGDSAGGHSVAQEVYSSVDVDFLREVMNNLLENAIKYNSEGGGIWVNVRGDGDRVLINVTDTGIGISPDDLKHIFQKFYRADNSQTRTIGGTGLGLYLVRERVEAMGGKVWAESSFGEGSTFYVSLPRLTLDEYQRRRALLGVEQEREEAAAEQPADLQQTAQVINPMIIPMSAQPAQPKAPAKKPPLLTVNSSSTPLPAPTAQIEKRTQSTSPTSVAQSSFISKNLPSDTPTPTSAAPLGSPGGSSSATPPPAAGLPGAPATPPSSSTPPGGTSSTPPLTT